MANSNTEHSKKLRQKTVKEWQKNNHEKNLLNKYASASRTFARRATVKDLPRLREIEAMQEEKLEELRIEMDL